MPVVCLLASCFAPMKAQGMAVTDSLWCQQSLPVCIVDDTHGLKLREVLIPTAVVGVSALYAVGGDWFSSQRECVQDALSGKGRNKVKIDDYLQYSQMVAVYGLNLAGVKGAHSFKDRTIILAMSWAVQAVLTNAMKYSFREKRPDSGARNSFPSGHTATAFMGAEFLYREYRDVSPWIGYAGYAVAACTGYLRIYNNRHYFNDVLAGACLGIVSTKWHIGFIRKSSGNQAVIRQNCNVPPCACHIALPVGPDYAYASLSDGSAMRSLALRLRRNVLNVSKMSARAMVAFSTCRSYNCAPWRVPDAALPCNTLPIPLISSTSRICNDSSS